MSHSDYNDLHRLSVLIQDDDEGDEAGVLLGGTLRNEEETDLPKDMVILLAVLNTAASIFMIYFQT